MPLEGLFVTHTKRLDDGAGDGGSGRGEGPKLLLKVVVIIVAGEIHSTR
jgi:hypothetical protein